MPRHQVKRQERYDGIIAYFKEAMPTAETELVYTNPFELLVAVILSAQCTDKRVNMITPALFEAFPTAEVMAAASPELLFEYIRSVSYPNNKSKHLASMAKMLVEDFGSVVPDTIDELVKLPGVGRKTANVVASVIYDVPAMPVDTHVYRVSHRIGLVPSTANTPLKVERMLERHIPRDLLSRAHHWLILHGRYVCIARSPKCMTCSIRDYCRHGEKKTALDKG